jgi:hypothetical protein
MNQIELLLLGVALGAVPTSDLARLTVAVLAKKFGVSPKEIKRYSDATEQSAD